jgi:hypothetical protein
MKSSRRPIDVDQLRALTGANVSSHSAFSSGIVSSQVGHWHKQVGDRFEQLIKLENGWDGYGGVAVRFDNACFAIEVLKVVCSLSVPSPQIVPGAAGDLQIEWHTDGADIELHVISPYNVHAWRATGATGSDGEEERLTNDFRIVTQWINEMMESQSAAQTAAA